MKTNSFIWKSTLFIKKLIEKTLWTNVCGAKTISALGIIHKGLWDDIYICLADKTTTIFKLLALETTSINVKTLMLPKFLNFLPSIQQCPNFPTNSWYPKHVSTQPHVHGDNGDRKEKIPTLDINMTCLLPVSRCVVYQYLLTQSIDRTTDYFSEPFSGNMYTLYTSHLPMQGHSL